MPILVPILALIAVVSAGVPAGAADADLLSQGRSTFTGQTDAPSPRGVPTRIYVPLHPAEPAEVGKEFAPIQASPFGAGSTAARAAASSTAAGKPPPPGAAAIPAQPRAGIEPSDSERRGLY